MKKELLQGLTDEQIAKVKACKNHEELLKVAKEEGFELTDEQLQAVSGGGNCWSGSSYPECPMCESSNVKRVGVLVGWEYTCKNCKYVWIVETE